MTGEQMGEWKPETGENVVREETVNGYRIRQMRHGGVEVTKGDYWGWSYPGDFDHEKAIAEKLS